MKMRTVIVYYSMGGNVKFAAHEIARQLGADTLEIAPSKAYPSRGFRKFIWGGKSAVMGEQPKLLPYVFDADAYDRVVLAFPVWASNFAPPIRSFIMQNEASLASKTIAAVACCAGGDADKAFAKLRDFLDISAFEATAVFVDPKDKPSDEKVRMMAEFAEALK